MEQWALITPGPYITAPEIFVDPETVDPVNIAAEDAIFESIVTQITADKYWKGTFVPPVLDETCIRGYFGNRRSYNNGALLYYHTGVDFGYCLGTEVFAPASGKVVLLEEDLIIRGNAILIDHGWGVYSGYWHLAEFNVALGDMVDPGQLIGIMGNTGRSQGPHLHFEIIVNGISVNPLTWLEKEFP
jgi:murein DD-endopeptidase MepM/ murein hydrolase activator NlpD